MGGELWEGGGEEEGSGEQPWQEGRLLVCSAPTLGKAFPASPAEHTHPRRQVWTALCQQPKINKILSARNLLKHIHLAVLGKERQEEGSRRKHPHMTFWKQSLTLRTSPLSSAEEGERWRLPSLPETRYPGVFRPPHPPAHARLPIFHLIFRGAGKLLHLSLKLPTSG